MDTITDILARPGDAARQLSEMRAALAALTARLAEVTAERDLAVFERRGAQADARISAGRADRVNAVNKRLQSERDMFKSTCLQMDRRDIQRAAAARKVAQAYRQLDAEASEWMLKALKQAAETGTARAEVRELRAALERARALADEWREYSTDVRTDAATRAFYGFCSDSLAAALAGADGAR